MENINNYNGVAEDLRTPEQKTKDYPHEEVAMAVPLNWKQKLEDAPVYSLRDQDGSYSCVGQGSGKGLETILKDIISAHPIYRRRANYPSPGMWLQDAGDIVRNCGTTTEDKDVSQKISEDEMNRDVTVPTPISKYNYAFPNVKNIDEIAQAIETRGHCLITFRGTYEEYANKEKPVVIPANDLNIAHCICGIYYFTDDYGNKCILCDESWGPNNIRRRIMTEDYLKARGTGAMYFIPPKPQQLVKKPNHNFNSVLLYGQSNYSIKMLQDIFKYEDIGWPQNIDSTGYFGPITAKYLLIWQKLHKVAPLIELNSLQGRRAGPKTIKKLNELYSNN